MSCKNSVVSHKTDYLKCPLSIGDVVRWGIIPCRVVGFTTLFPNFVYLVSLSSDGVPQGEVLRAPLSELHTYLVGTSVNFRLNGDIVSGVVRSYDLLGRCVVKLDDSYLPENPIRVFRLSPAELLEVA